MTELVLVRGDTLSAVITVTESDGATPFDLTGWTPRWTAKPAVGWEATLDAGATLTATLGSGLTLLSGPAGTLSLLIAASATAVLALGVYAWDLQLSAGGVVHTVVVGSLTVSGDASRTTP